MEKIQEDTLNMYQTVNDVLVSNNAIYAANAPFVTAAGELATGIDVIQDLRDQQDEDIRGVAQDKQLRRESLESQTYNIGSVIAFYASSINNRTLLQKVSFTRSDLSRARDNEVAGMSEQVHEEAVANAAAIVPYGVTGAMTIALQTAIADYVNYISKPRAAKSETSAATIQLPDAFQVVDTLLQERIDNAMQLFNASNPDFYTQYFNARTIINSPTQKRALEATFVDSVTQQPIARMDVSVDGSINRRSSDLGNIRVQNLAQGAHSLTATLPGYVLQTVNFNVISGETTKLTVSMVIG